MSYPVSVLLLPQLSVLAQNKPEVSDTHWTLRSACLHINLYLKRRNLSRVVAEMGSLQTAKWMLCGRSIYPCMPPYDKGDREGDLNKSGDMHFSDMMTMQTDERSAYHLQMQRQCQKQNPAVVINLRCCMEALNLDEQACSPKFPLYE